MSEPAAEYRVWRPEPTYARPWPASGPAYESPSLDARRDRVRTGFVDMLVGRLGIPPDDLLQRVGVRRTAGGVGASSASADGRVIGAPVDTLHELHLLAEHAGAVLGHPDSVPTRFGSDVGALGRTRPLDGLDTNAGRERVAEVLNAIACGFPG